MLLIQVYIGEKSFAINVEFVRAIVPAVSLRPVPCAPEAVVGVFEYRGNIVPVVDLCYLVEHRAASVALSSRFIIVNVSYTRGSVEGTELLALLAERVTETVNVDDDDLRDPGVHADGAAFLGPVYRSSEGKLIQLFEVDTILSQEVRETLYRT